MATVESFTLEGDLLALIGDRSTDVDLEPDLAGVRGTCTISPLFRQGDVVLAPTLSPRPAMLLPQRIVASFDEQGRLTYKGNIGVKLPANTSVLNLFGELVYRIDFGNDLSFGTLEKIPPPASFSFNAPHVGGGTVNLVSVARVPGSAGVGLSQGIQGIQGFSFAGFVPVLGGTAVQTLVETEDDPVPIGDPIPLPGAGWGTLTGKPANLVTFGVNEFGIYFMDENGDPL